MTGRIRADIVFRSFGDWGALLPETVSIPSVFDFENCDHQYGHHQDWPGQDRKHFAAPELTRPLNAPGFTVFQPFKIQPERYPTSYLGASRSCDLAHLAMWGGRSSARFSAPSCKSATIATLGISTVAVTSATSVHMTTACLLRPTDNSGLPGQVS